MSTKSFDEKGDFAKTADIVEDLRERLDVTKQIHNLIFADPEKKEMALNILNFYNQVKKVIIRSGGNQKELNIRILLELIHELRIKLDITKSSLAAEKTMREVNFGLGSSDEPITQEMLHIRKKRIRNVVLREFNMINMERVQNAIEECDIEDDSD